MHEMGETAISKNMTEFDMGDQQQNITTVVLVVDENTQYTATTGGDGGTMRVENPWGTQAMANNILESLTGWRYQPYTADDAHVTPAAELGDGINMRGTNPLYSCIYTQDTEYGSMCLANVSAPSEEEVEHEYPYVSKGDRETDRRFTEMSEDIAANYSELSIRASQISASVTSLSNTKLDTKHTSSSFSWALTSSGFYLNNGNSASASNYVMAVDSNGAVVKGSITATTGYIGGTNGWVIGEGKIYKGTAGQSSSLTLDANGNTTATIAGASRSGLAITAGSDFGVTKSGTLYAKGAVLSGTITATSGTIGGFTIGSSSISATGLTLSSSGTISGGTSYAWSINASGVATFANVNIQRGTFSGSASGSFSGTGSFGSGSSLRGSFIGTGALSTSSTVGGTNIATYVENLAANTITANYIYSKVASLASLKVSRLAFSSGLTYAPMSIKIPTGLIKTKVGNYLTDVSFSYTTYSFVAR